MERLEITRAKELRNDIISRLYTIYPNDTALLTLKNLLRYKSYHSENDIKKAVYYLEGRGYIAVGFPANEFAGNRTAIQTEEQENVIRLTPKGINLAEGDIEDVGVLRNE